jgi:hypothetical protein
MKIYDKYSFKLKVIKLEVKTTIKNIIPINRNIKILFMLFNLKLPKKRPIFAENKIVVINK